MIKKLSILHIFILFITLFSCGKEVNDSINVIQEMENTLNNIPNKKWKTLATKRIYFGHQSVGFNIVDGLEMHSTKIPEMKLNLQLGNELELFNSPVFAHSSNGKNGNPKSKIDAFYQKMEEGLGENTDIAGFKFCYVDFNTETNISDVFDHYKKKINKLVQKYPKVKIVHFTAPLTSLQKGPKGFVNKLLGRDIGIEDNYVREQFNNLLRQEYKDQYIFDLAKYESISSDGSRNYTLKNDEKVYSMLPTYTNDGGHLSKTGKYFISGKLLLFLMEETNDRNN